MSVCRGDDVTGSSGRGSGSSSTGPMTPARSPRWSDSSDDVVSRSRAATGAPGRRPSSDMSSTRTERSRSRRKSWKQQEAGHVLDVTLASDWLRRSGVVLPDPRLIFTTRQSDDVIVVLLSVLLQDSRLGPEPPRRAFPKLHPAPRCYGYRAVNRPKPRDVISGRKKTKTEEMHKCGV